MSLETSLDTCRICLVSLKVDTNWCISHSNRNQKICRSCNKKQAKEWRKKNPQKQKEYSQKRGKWWLESRYGITQDEWNLMYERQQGICAICKSDDPKGNHRIFHVDHCHKTNKVRGLLCDTCNRGLGMFYDNINILKSAIKYLEDSNEN